MDCPKEVVMWNYFDHEHLVGTHNTIYKNVRVVAEKNNWALVDGNKKLPLLPIYTRGIAFQHLENNIIRTIHQDIIGFLLENEVHLTDLPNDRCLVAVTFKIKIPSFLKIFEPIFKIMSEKWFEQGWEEDAPMRLRRWKVHKLGFKDFYGIEYINKKLPKPEKLEVSKYEFKLPITYFSSITSIDGLSNPFCKKSVELGYKN